MSLVPTPCAICGKPTPYFAPDMRPTHPVCRGERPTSTEPPPATPPCLHDRWKKMGTVGMKATALTTVDHPMAASAEHSMAFEVHICGRCNKAEFVCVATFTKETPR